MECFGCFFGNRRSNMSVHVFPSLNNPVYVTVHMTADIDCHRNYLYCQRCRPQTDAGNFAARGGPSTGNEGKCDLLHGTVTSQRRTSDRLGWTDHCQSYG